MAMIITKQILRPSSPTPQAFKNHKLSYLDQIQAPIYIPLLFFYKNEESKYPDQISQRFKQSLSEILTIFYPLAGTMRHNSFVDCNDRGVEFVEVRVHARLAQFIQDPKMEELKQLIPVDCISHTDDDFLLLVKISYFDCGEVVVGVCMSHKIGDGISLAAFMNAWAATCRGESSSEIIHPSFDLALHFPPKDHLSSASSFRVAIAQENIMTKRLVFDREKLEKLRKRIAASSDGVRDPSRVEAVSVFIWKSLIEAHKAESHMTETPAVSIASHAVNLRPRTVPQMDQTFGNCYAPASAVVSWDEDYVHHSRLRAALREIDDDYINKVLKADNNYLTQDQIGDLFKPENSVLSSWWRFPVYKVDFGWGKPVWVSTTTIQYMNLIIFTSTPSEDGIEAWVTTTHNFFQVLQANYNKLDT
uniref:Alcohol acetyltransferase n=1 Tax=Lavandula x intermedia TaxID=1196215 RepID=A0A0K0LCG5_LAVIN|nr:alcohol acetyltransferase [Lavandula x intermedia]UQZ10113.1 BAHD57 [Lavandula angustifolia]